MTCVGLDGTARCATRCFLDGTLHGELRDGQLTVGLDMGDRSSFYGVLNSAGEVIVEVKVATRPEAMKEMRFVLCRGPRMPRYRSD